MSWFRRAVTRVALAGAGAATARAVVSAVRRSPAAPSLDRVNHRGATVNLAAGPALAVAATTASAAGTRSPALASAALVAGLGSGAVGLYDDIVGQRPDHRAKGFRGHLSALADGRVTSGLVKIAGIGASALLAAGLVGRARAHLAASPVRSVASSGFVAVNDAATKAGRGRGGVLVDVIIDTGLIAGAANLANLLDLRPGRALKAGLVVSGPLAAAGAADLLAGPTGAAAALLRDDLEERVMLGDAGANAWGAVLGLAAAYRGGRTARVLALAGIVGLTLASEKVSFTTVIESTPGLRAVDAWGRRG